MELGSPALQADSLPTELQESPQEGQPNKIHQLCMCVCVYLCVSVCVCVLIRRYRDREREKKIHGIDYMPFFAHILNGCLPQFWGALHIARSIVTNSSKVTDLHLAIQGGNAFFI